MRLFIDTFCFYIEEKNMERILTYLIERERPAHLTVRSYLMQLGYSSQNLIQLKKDERCILVNGTPCYLKQPLNDGDVLTVHIIEETSSEKIPPVFIYISFASSSITAFNNTAQSSVEISLELWSIIVFSS